MDAELGTPFRIPGKGLTGKERKLPSRLQDGDCPNPDKASQYRAIRGA